ncbi:DUF1501 domain-containing protein [Thalassotalea euphylliae]|uniref:DUF1501 domain-containing protein n=1 Tax=Thalassotalea euphylliae TaxID=1655234 RepID=A0A3E0UDB1_9GAMM|nr:DUF1501 domain-containing protein [Thalassotalea euphylliae]REL35011.1 DUF1501 domain-containing protein [Thalassotalea euphylliae]
MNRRNFLKASSLSASAAMTASMAGLGALLNSRNAQAAEEDYKALVCVFLYGGMDNHDTIIPYDTEGYSQWSQIRSSMLSNYKIPRTRENLLPITSSASRFGERTFALPPEMKGLQQLYQQGHMAVVGNVGPLVEVTSATSFNNDTARLPARLFSHNDQQSTWMSGTTEGAQLGWAGQLNDALIQSGQQSVNTFSAITTSETELLLTGEQTTPFHVQGDSAVSLDILDETSGALQAQLLSHFSGQNTSQGAIIQRDLAGKINQAYQANKLYSQALNSTSSSNLTMPNTRLGRQLGTVAKTINARSQLQSKRQLFIVAIGGFDTHSGQAQSLPQLQQMLDDAILGFYQNISALNLADKVTLFTASDFGRTLAVNGDGTDHGWGAHHFVVGGAVNGGHVFGDIPPASFNHQFDAGSGRLIPTTSVEQYVANFGAWLGLSEAELATVFPNLTNFAERPTLFKTELA